MRKERIAVMNNAGSPRRSLGEGRCNRFLLPFDTRPSPLFCEITKRTHFDFQDSHCQSTTYCITTTFLAKKTNPFPLSTLNPQLSTCPAIPTHSNQFKGVSPSAIPAADCGLWTADCGLWTVDSGLYLGPWTLDFGLTAPDLTEPTIHNTFCPHETT